MIHYLLHTILKGEYLFDLLYQANDTFHLLCSLPGNAHSVTKTISTQLDTWGTVELVCKSKGGNCLQINETRDRLFRNTF